MMVRQVDAIFIQGAFRPLAPVSLPEGARVHLRVEDQTNPLPVKRISTPKLTHPEEAADFVMEVGEGNSGGL